VLLGLIGAKFIESNGNFKETIEVALTLFNHNKEEKFPVYKKMKKFYEFWNSKPYTRILKIHHEVEIKVDTLYYVVFI
jgi:hypothetical protein